jgi:hypothetical protein
LSFVVEKQKTNYPMAYVYVDGVLSGAVIYGDEAADNTSELFKDSKDNQAELRIDSTDASVKIYSIRLYSRALNH